MERIKKAGRVKAMAKAKDSPADAMVWTMFASRIVPLLWNREKGAKAPTATGIDKVSVSYPKKYA